MRTGLGICGLLVLVALPVDGGSQLTMRASPAQSFAPSFVRVQVRIEPHADNRWLEVIAESDEFYRSSEIQLDGDRAPATTYLEYPNLPGGDYQIVGVLKDGAAHQRSIARDHVRVIGSGISR